MDFDIYCDESCQEAFSDKDAHRFLGIGGVMIPRQHRAEFKQGIQSIKSRFKSNAEFKWNKVSPNREGFYKALVEYFFEHDWIRFRVLVVEAAKIDLEKYHDGDGELGYYKFYYQLLSKWIGEFNRYAVFLDLKTNRVRGRLEVLKECLQNSTVTSTVENVQALPSDESLGIQFADLLTGAVIGKFNQQFTSAAKAELIEKLELYNGGRLQPTPRSTEKLNIFHLKLEGGW